MKAVSRIEDTSANTPATESTEQQSHPAAMPLARPHESHETLLIAPIGKTPIKSEDCLLNAKPKLSGQNQATGKTNIQLQTPVAPKSSGNGHSHFVVAPKSSGSGHSHFACGPKVEWEWSLPLRCGPKDEWEWPFPLRLWPQRQRSAQELCSLDLVQNHPGPHSFSISLRIDYIYVYLLARNVV